MNIYEKLLNIQSGLSVPKSNFNSFGKYAYRNCEDILEALKPLLAKYKATLILTDEIVVLGENNLITYKEEVYDTKAKKMKDETIVSGMQRYYVKATAKLIDVEEDGSVEVHAYAREDETKKGMDLSQLTGSTSSYARKYALNGLFAIDDTKDSDATNTHGKGQENATIGKVNNLANAARETYQKHHGDVPIESDDFKCSSCQMDINQAVKTFSEKKYGKTLCIDCQKKVK